MEKSKLESESFLARHLASQLAKHKNIDKAVEEIGSQYKAVSADDVTFSEFGLVTSLKRVGLTDDLNDDVLSVINEQQTYLQRLATAVSGYFYQQSLYTGLVLLVAFLMMLLFVTTVLPSFEMMFMSMGADLPAMTYLLLNYSNYFSLALLLLISWPLVSYTLLFRNFKTSLLNRAALNTGRIKVPGVKALSAMIEAVQAILDCQLKLSSNQEAAVSSSLSVIKQNKSDLLENRDIEHLDIAKNMGSLANELTHLLQVFESQLVKRLAKIRLLLSVFILILLGGFVGFIVVAIYTPVFQFGAVI